ncbi:hypothetical protein ACLKA6_006021 [Drosophila palustris]
MTRLRLQPRKTSNIWRAISTSRGLRHSNTPEPDPHVNGADDDDPSEEKPGLEEEPDLEPWVRDFLKWELALFETLTGVTHIAEHVIIMKDDRPIKQRYYPKNPAMQRIIDEQVDEPLKNNCIEPSKSPHSAPIVLVRKKTGDIRMCIDYRQLNANSIPDAYPLPRIHHILERLRNAKYISTLDLKSGYWQIPMARGSREYTAFTVKSDAVWPPLSACYFSHTC